MVNGSDGTPKPQRVVSLLGAATETIYRIGLGSKLVGRSHECDYPPACLSLPCISRPRLDVNASSINIDEAVRAHSAAGEPVYKLDDAVISELRPDLIIAQDHCRVCAVTPGDMAKSAVCSKIRQLVVKPSTLVECLEDVVTVADALGYPERGVALKKTLEMRMDRVREVVSSVSIKKTRVAVLEWCDPIMGCGYWIPELVGIAGGECLHCPPPGGATPTISFQALLDSKPDVVVFALCGFGLTRAATEIVNSWGLEKLQQLLDLCNRRVFIVDGNYLINRSGPRVVESAEALAEAIHPALQGHFGHFGTDLLSTLEQAIVMVRQGDQTGSAKIRPPPFQETATTTVSITENVLPTTEPHQAVSMQLQYIQTGDMMKAFSLNSTANQARWCSPDRFAAVLKSHGDFSRLLSEVAQVGKAEVASTGLATVLVSLPEQKGVSPIQLLWTMVAEKSHEDADITWRTEKVAAH